jgi:putative cardiolipin synthase
MPPRSFQPRPHSCRPTGSDKGARGVLFDPRSAHLNTEIGVIIQDPDMASGVTRRIVAALPEQTFQVIIEEGKLRWRGRHQGQETIYMQEPDTTWGQRVLALFARIRPRSQL